MKGAGILIMCTSVFFAQSASGQQPLQTGDSLFNAHEYRKAKRALKQYYLENSIDLNTAWLYGQVLYETGSYMSFKKTYEQAIDVHPTNYYLKLDYAFKLMNKGELRQPLQLLKTYKLYDPNSPKVNITIATLLFWTGDYELALREINSILEKYSYPYAQALKKDILSAKSLNLDFSLNQFIDDQPLMYLAPSSSVSKNWNRVLSSELKVESNVFDADLGSFNIIQANHDLNLFQGNTHVQFDIGGYVFPSKKTNWYASVGIKQKLFRRLESEVKMVRQPYLNTLSSLSAEVINTQYQLNAVWVDKEGWSVDLINSYSRFADPANYVLSMGGWVFTPPIHIAKLKIRLGYAYGYSNSKEDQFTSELSLADVIQNNSLEQQLSGIYSPYFTPRNRKSHSALIALSYQISNTLELNLNGNIGFLGATDNSYIYLNAGTNGQLYLDKDFYNTTFFPNEAGMSISWKLNNRNVLSGGYKLLQNNFYTSQLVGLSYKMNLWNDTDE